MMLVPPPPKKVLVADLQHAGFIFEFPVRRDPKCRDVARSLGIWPFKSIVLGDAWFLLTAYEQQAVLMHEVGHCRLWHKELKLLMLPFAYCKWAQAASKRHEFEADAFAVRSGHGFGMLQLTHRSVRAQWVLDAIPGPPTLEQVIDRLIFPTWEERAHAVLRLIQEVRHEERIAA